MKWVRYILAGVVLAVVAAGIWFGVVLHRVTSSTVPNSYAVWWVADLVILHMEANEGAWPTGWDDLQDDYVTATETSGEPWTFESLQERVQVDWDADPDVLARATPSDDEPPFRVIWLRDGGGEHWAGQEPNQMILEYLQEHPESLPAGEE